jgi:hypothetical protein
VINPVGIADQEPCFVAYFTLYFDESGKSHTHPATSLTGVCTPNSRIGQFEDAWRGLLRSYGLKSFHMVDAIRPGKPLGNVPSQSWPERFEILKPFADCINKNLEIGILQAWDVSGFTQMSQQNAAGLIGSPTDPYYVSFTRGLLELLDYIQYEDRLCIVCDEDPETAVTCYAHYRAVKDSWKQARKQAVSISFANDFYFPALQAADMVAGLARLEANRQFFGEDYEARELLDYLIAERAKPTMTWKKMFADKEKALSLAESLKSLHSPKWG